MDNMTLDEAIAASDGDTAVTNNIFLIDSESRTINVPPNGSILGVETDNGVERKYFKCPRIVGDNIDLSKHKIYVSYIKASNATGTTFVGEPDSYYCDDMAVDDTGDYITFSWCLSGNVLKAQGYIAYKVVAKHTDGDYSKTRWNTRPAIGTVYLTVPDGEPIEYKYPDIVTQLLDRMDAVEDIATVEAMQGYVDDYLGRNPVQLDNTLTDPEKAAPADMVGELRSDLADLENDYINTHQSFINNTGCDWTLSDVQNSNMCITPVFTSKGKIVIKFDNDIVNIGLLLYVISETSGSTQSWILNNQEITETEYTVSVDDNVRVLIQAVGGMATYYDRIVKATTIYTLTDDGLMTYLKNKIIGSKKIWCFGDSLTAGVITGTTTIEGSYPYWLNKFLGENIDISNFGVPGDTVQNMRDIITSKTFYGNCDIAILMIGTNGFVSSGTEEDTTTPIGAYHQAIKHIIDSSKGTTKIIIMNPPKSERDGVPQRWLDEMHYNISKIANAYGIDCIDLFQFLPFDVNDRTYYSSDKTHFTKVGYYYIAFIVYIYLINNMTNSQIGGNPTFDY